MTAKTLLAAAIAALLLSAPVSNAGAQGVSRETRPAQDEPSEDEGHSRKSKDGKGDEGPSFPNATREDPGKGKPKLQAKLQKMNSAFQSDKFTEVMAMADEVFAEAKATPYDRAQAAYFASYAAINADDQAKAITYGMRALTENALSNEIHFQLMQNIAQMHLQGDQYNEALALADRFIAETRIADDSKIQALRGNALYRLERFPEAIEALKKAVAMAEQIAAKTPGDKKAQLNLATVYAQAEQPEKAAAVFERLRTAGLLTDEKDYEMGYRLLATLDGRERDTIAFINGGLEKGILKPSAPLYAVLGQSYYYSEQVPQAIEAWGKGAPLAKDGEMYLNLAKVTSQEERWAESTAAARQALAKGVRKPGDAWIVIAIAAQEAGDKAGQIAAFREAAKDPATRD
jgi:tetratricopeptide (TPR) repeat protein